MVGFAGYVAVVAYTPQTIATAATTAGEHKPQLIKRVGSSAPTLLMGKPVRLIIPDSGIDLPIDEGFFDTTSNSWTLSDSRLQYAMITAQANNHSGSTFVYGHGTDKVLGALATREPAHGATARIHTDTGRIFTYSFQSSQSLTPGDTSIFNYTGPPILTIQTCTGNLSEWRTLFTFKFEEVV